MTKHITIALLSLLTLTACNQSSDSPPLGDGAKVSYQPSKATVLPMTFPAGSKTRYIDPGIQSTQTKPKHYQHGKEWVVYMASPGWTNGGTDIVDRLAMDAVAIDRVRQFVLRNHLHDKVKVAWLQYDTNPSSSFYGPAGVEDKDFVPLFLKPHGPNVDYYIYSPVSRGRSAPDSIEYDTWLKPYLPFAKKVGDEYVAATDFQKVQGFDDRTGPYWDSWSRHWFIVNQSGLVVDAYFSNLGYIKTKGAELAIGSLVHHLSLDKDDLKLLPFTSSNYTSTYTPPYWEKISQEVFDQLGLDDHK